MKTLLAGWWAGELGWEVSVWASLVRKYSHKFDKTVIVCRTGHDYLYADFANEFVHHDKDGLPDRWLLNGKKVGLPSKICDMYPKATICRPRRKKCTSWPREYFPYGQEPTEETESYRIVFHARAETKYGQKNWNYPVDWYSKMLQILEIDPQECASIGSMSGAAHVPRTRDVRGIPLKRLAHILAHSGVCVGSSSGPMHFSHLCACPIVVITDDTYQKSIGGTNKDRYYKIWRAWDAPVKVLCNENWRSKPEKVAKAVEKFL